MSYKTGLTFILLIISLISYQTVSYAEDQKGLTEEDNSLVGFWYNFDPHGCSTMYITSVSKTGQLIGDFANGQAGWCAKPEEWFSLTGAMIGENALSLKVNWDNGTQDCQSTTIWDGSIKDDIISTNWVITSTNGGKTYRGEDTFSRKCKCHTCPTP
ncbi:avidin/streptavidin family protein [Shewanella surugensis]|uniref:Avidin n=1 Tax=Shewanella surugensis TaxID=212020 RepID=A0ABT0LFP6_9GAMM|nr:avidin/streptavidin family protein [Shewanella surugensis]MCL1126527.1 hypothetical protein [Shewanella surugensis]